jgi:dTDP-4-dehydrorhamnose reductase
VRVLVTGAKGLLGSTLCPLLRGAGHEVLEHGLAGAPYTAELCDAGAVARLLDDAAPDAVVNLAAATNVDACERDVLLAFRGNVLSVERLAAAIRDRRDRGIHLVQLSTDQLYDGEGPHAEDDARPRNVYALTKYAGELAAAAAGATVLRTNFFGQSRAPGRKSFSDWIVGAARSGEPIRLFDDVHFSPLLLETLCGCIGAVLARPAPGVFNLGATTGLSKAAFALGLARRLGLPTGNMTVSQSSAAGLAAYRPKDMRMRCDRFAAAFAAPLPTLEAELDALARRMSHA